MEPFDVVISEKIGDDSNCEPLESAIVCLEKAITYGVFVTSLGQLFHLTKSLVKSKRVTANVNPSGNLV